jgi:hypothetical protein
MDLRETGFGDGNWIYLASGLLRTRKETSSSIKGREFLD